MTAPERDRSTRTRTATRTTAASTATRPRRAAKADAPIPSTSDQPSRDTTPAGFRSVVIESVTPELDGAGQVLRDTAEMIGKSATAIDALQRALDPIVVDLAASCVDPESVTRYDRELKVKVDRVRARYGTWYEIFPRSQGTDPTRGAT